VSKKLPLLKYKKLIMLLLVVLAVVICVFATYITEYNLNKVSREDVLTTEVTSSYESNEELLENFKEFKIYLSKDVEPYKDNGEMVYGKKEFTIITEAKEDSEIKGTIKVTIGLGANWIKYISKTATKSVTVGKETTLTISDIDTSFPANGYLLFVQVDSPVLYVLVEWSDYAGSRHHTYLEYNYKTYSVKPEAKTE
jgi:hypothetical protein